MGSQPRTTAAIPTGDYVRMDETVDVTEVREVPMMEVSDWNKGLELFLKLMMREPFPEERPSLSQMTAFL